MSRKKNKNIVASVLARLRGQAKSSGVPFQQVLQQYAIERFLYRISKSEHAQSVILKGALLLKTIGIPSVRHTNDIDMLRTGKADRATLIALVRDCASLEVDVDGLTFPADSVTAEDIIKDSEYTGTRIRIDARMDNVRLRIQIDFGVGDVMVPGPRMIEYPIFLDGDAIPLLAYPVESAIAEKLQAMVALGNANSSMKDTTCGSIRSISTSIRAPFRGPLTLRSRIGRHPSLPPNLQLSLRISQKHIMPSGTRS